MNMHFSASELVLNQALKRRFCDSTPLNQSWCQILCEAYLSQALSDNFNRLVISLVTGPKSNLTLFSCAINQILENEPDLFLYEVRNNILVSCSKSAKSCSYTLFKTKLLHAHKRRSSSASYHCSIGPNFLGFGNTSWNRKNKQYDSVYELHMRLAVSPTVTLTLK